MVCDIWLDGEDAQKIHILEVFKNLAKLNDTRLFAPKPEKTIGITKNIILVPCQTPIFKSAFHQVSLFFFLFYYCLKLSPNVIYSRYSAFTFSPVIVSKIFRVPYVVEVNGLILEEIKVANASKWMKLMAKMSEKLNYKHAKSIVVVTQAIRDSIKDRYNIPDDRIVVIENGANTDLFIPTIEDEVKSGLDGDYNYVGFSGSFNVWHGVEDVVRSAPLVLKKVENTKFLLVGDGKLKGEIIRMVNNLNLTKNFIFIKRISYEEVPKYVKAFDVCVIFKKKEIPGSPLKLWEYMACGKPVIATNSKDFRILKDINAGILVDPERPEEVADAIVTLLGNRELREEMGENGRRYVVENRSWEAVAREVNRVLKEALLK